jgi:hypothetical protein
MAKDTKVLGVWSWVSIIGALASILALFIILFSPLLQRPFVIGFFILIFIIAVGSLVRKFWRMWCTLYERIVLLLDAAEVSIMGAAHIKRRWIPIIKKQNTYKLHKSEIRVKYHDKDGKRVTYSKRQDILALQGGVREVFDSELRADGPIDWNTLTSTPGKPQLSRKEEIGSLSEIPTIFDSDLPTDEVTHREMSFEVVGAFLKDKETLVVTISIPTDLLILVAELVDGEKILDPKGEVKLGKYHLDRIHPPQLLRSNELVWTIRNPQICEKYILSWRVR